MASTPIAHPIRPRSGLFDLQRFTYRYLGRALGHSF